MSYNFCGSALCQPDRRCPGYTERPEVRSYIRIILEYPISSPLYRYRKMGFLVKNDNADLITIFF